jgi:multisubunit Na+/H+ antiporter MnhG subunit
MRSSRPSTVVAIVLAALFVIARPEVVNAALSTLGWLLTSPAGSVLLGAALLLSLGYCAAASLRGERVHAYH